MQIFVLGKTKTGKSTLSQILQQNKDIPIYEAGAWARQEFSLRDSRIQDEFSPQFKEDLTQYALDILAHNPHHSFEQYQKWKSKNHCPNVIISGVRNPDDFFNMTQLDSNNLVIFITSNKQFEGSLEFFEQGLEIIKNYIRWKNKIHPFFNVIEISEQDIANNSESLTLNLKGLL